MSLPLIRARRENSATDMASPDVVNETDMALMDVISDRRMMQAHRVSHRLRSIHDTKPASHRHIQPVHYILRCLM